MSTPDITATPVGHSGTAVDITERKSWSGGGGLATIIILISIILIAPAIFLIGTIRHTGLRAIPPLSNPTKVSIKVRNFETNTIKVNDLNGNPINIGAIVVWQVADTAKATFAVENVDDFIHSQAESALRHVATTHPYDSTDTTTIPSLSGSTDIVSAELAEEVAARATMVSNLLVVLCSDNNAQPVINTGSLYT